MILADLNLSDLLWSMFTLFFFVILLWIVFGIIGDIFRSDDLSGVSKALWCLAIIIVPWVTIFVYLIARGHGMSRRSVRSNPAAQGQYDAYASPDPALSGPAGEIKSAKELLDSGVISAEQFEEIKARALAAT